MATLGIYYWNSGSPELMLFKRSGGGWSQLGSAYSIGAAGGRDAAGARRPSAAITFLENGVRDVGHGQQLHRRRAGHHGLRQRRGRQLVRRGRRDSYSVGGTVSGLSGTVVLQDNGGDDLSVSANGSFTFATPLASGAGYNVTVKTNPSGQSCTVVQRVGHGGLGQRDQRRGLLHG